MFKIIHTLVADEEAVAMVCAVQLLSMGGPFLAKEYELKRLVNVLRVFICMYVYDHK